MNGAVMVMLISLGAASVLSILLWLVSKLSRKRTPSFLEQLNSVAARSGPPVGPASGIANLKPISPDREQHSQMPEQSDMEL